MIGFMIVIMQPLLPWNNQIYSRIKMTSKMYINVHQNRKEWKIGRLLKPRENKEDDIYTRSGSLLFFLCTRDNKNMVDIKRNIPNEKQHNIFSGKENTKEGYLTSIPTTISIAGTQEYLSDRLEKEWVFRKNISSDINDDSDGRWHHLEIGSVTIPVGPDWQRHPSQYWHLDGKRTSCFKGFSK